MKGTRFRGQIRSESPDTTGPGPAGSPPKTAVTTRSQIRRLRSVGECQVGGAEAGQTRPLTLIEPDSAVGCHGCVP